MLYRTGAVVKHWIKVRIFCSSVVLQEEGGSMTKEDFIRKAELNDGTILLEDWETFSKGITGVTSDRNHVIYSYDKLADALRELYIKDGSAEDEFDAEYMAVDWLEYNTIRSLPYMPEEFRPIIQYDIDVVDAAWQ